MKFGWHKAKAQSNIRDHKVTFEEARAVFNDPLALEIDDPRHDEERTVRFGMSAGNRYLVVVYTERGPLTWIISAREMTPKERRNYER